jgi:RNA polymerase sigma-70 factor (ECF subfamily)
MTGPGPDSAETQGLLTKIRSGDEDAFERLIGRHRPFLRQVIELRMDARLRARVDPSDVVQEVQLEVFQRMSDYLQRQPMPFRLWLRKTAQERLIKTERRHLQTGRRTVEREVSLPDKSSLAFAQRLLASSASPSGRLERRELAQLIRRAIAGLADADRDILLMRNFEGLSNQEAAFALGVDPVTASKRHGRALLRLRQALHDQGFTESQL